MTHLRRCDRRGRDSRDGSRRKSRGCRSIDSKNAMCGSHRCIGCEPQPITATAPNIPSSRSQTTPPLVVIGSSTGGPDALRQVLKTLTPNCAVIIVQHLGKAYTAGLADWLTHETPWHVSLAEQGQAPQLGHGHLASTLEHLVLDDEARFAYEIEPRDHLHRPSVDVFFSSLCRSAVTPGVAILLTGMGRDGADGLRQLRETGWQTIAQDEESSVVWGMPGNAGAKAQRFRSCPSIRSARQPAHT